MVRSWERELRSAVVDVPDGSKNFFLGKERGVERGVVCD